MSPLMHQTKKESNNGLKSIQGRENMISNRFSLSLIATTALSASLGLALPALADEEEIIVTARRVEERLQDVPISITVFNQKQLDKQQHQFGPGSGDLYAEPFGKQPVRRGQRVFCHSRLRPGGHTTASVGVYFAEVVAPRAAAPQPLGRRP